MAYLQDSMAHLEVLEGVVPWMAGAANQCHRNGPSLQRNDWTRQQFLAAAAAAVTTTSPRSS